jgi:hypothetical protein
MQQNAHDDASAKCTSGHGRSQDVPLPNTWSSPVHIGQGGCSLRSRANVVTRRVAPPGAKEASKSIEAPLNIIKKITVHTSKVQHLFLKTLTSSYDGMMSLDIYIV